MPHQIQLLGRLVCRRPTQIDYHHEHIWLNDICGALNGLIYWHEYANGFRLTLIKKSMLGRSKFQPLQSNQSFFRLMLSILDLRVRRQEVIQKHLRCTSDSHHRNQFY